jgi:hypothetical protein
MRKAPGLFIDFKVAYGLISGLVKLAHNRRICSSINVHDVSTFVVSPSCQVFAVRGDVEEELVVQAV